MKMLEKRKDFPMLQTRMEGHPLVYLDSAATSQKPQSVIDALLDYYQSSCATVHRAIYEASTHATEAYEATRFKVKQLLNAASSDEIIFTRGTTDSINLVAASFSKKWIHPGDEILVSEMEHHSNIVPWKMVCEERGATLKVIPITDKAEIDLQGYQALLSGKTKIVAVSHVANATGTVNPIKTIVKLAHQHGAKVLIDGAQSAPHLAIDVQEIDADFYAFSGHKCYGPTGVGVLYGKKELLEALPPHHGGSDMIHTVSFSQITYAQPPLKFEPGTPMIAEVIALGSAIDYIQRVGLKEIEQWEHQLLLQAEALIASLPGIRIIGNAPQKGAILSFVVEGVHPLDIATLLSGKGIAIRTGHLCAQPTLHRLGVASVCRASFALYNTPEEVDYFIHTLKDVILLLR